MCGSGNVRGKTKGEGILPSGDYDERTTRTKEKAKGDRRETGKKEPERNKKYCCIVLLPLILRSTKQEREAERERESAHKGQKK